VRLPGGGRLSELFETIVIVPYLSMLGDPALDALTGVVTAFGDPDGSLPFARIEALLASGMRALVGNAADRSALLAALHRPAGPLLLSTHGSFDAENPFRSLLVAADGTLALEELVGNPGAETASVVILGACEAGKSPESSSDEPIGFPEMLLQLGCEQVAAPSWPVDDFASFVFLTTCCAKVSNGLALPQAVTAAARDFRNLDPRTALDRLDAAAARAAEPALEQWSAESGLNDRIAGLRRWLLGLRSCERPFRRPLDWAAYQIYVRALL
jgi:CHAT domain-containing protein